MERVDDLAIVTWSTEQLRVVEACGGDYMESSESLRRRVLPHIDQRGHLRRHQDSRGDRSTKRRILRAASEEFERNISAFQSGRVTGAENPRLRRYLRGARSHAAIPEQLIDLVAGRRARLGYPGKFSQGAQRVGAQ